MYCSRCGWKNKDSASYCSNCGSQLSKRTTSQGESLEPLENLFQESWAGSVIKGPGSILDGRYEIINEIAAGGMGRLFLAHDGKMDYPVVIKEMLQIDMSGDKLTYLQKRFMSEAQILFRLKHRSLPRVVDYFNKENFFYMIMEYVEGKDLSKILAAKPEGKLDFDQALFIMDRALRALEYLHKQNPPVIHRDVKPSNIMIDTKGEVALVDFGLARTFREGECGTARVGTSGFASPEHHTGRFKISSDLYSLGATIHYALSGENPRKRMPFVFPRLDQYRDDIPESFQELLDKLLDTDLEKRYKKARYAIGDLNKIMMKMNTLTREDEPDWVTSLAPFPDELDIPPHAVVDEAMELPEEKGMFEIGTMVDFIDEDDKTLLDDMEFI